MQTIIESVLWASNRKQINKTQINRFMYFIKAVSLWYSNRAVTLFSICRRLYWLYHGQV